MSDSGKEKPFKITLESTTRCNMSCRYCYSRPTQTASEITSAQAVSSIIGLSQALKGRPLIVVFHGGEPTLRGQEYYEEIIRSTTQKIGNVTWGMQSNGTAPISMYSALTALGVQLRISSDGPPEINRDACSSCKEENLIQAIRNTRSAVCTVGRHNVHVLLQVYDYFRSLGVSHVTFGPVKGDEKYSIGNAQYIARMLDLLYYSLRDGITIEPFNSIRRRLEILRSGAVEELPLNCQRDSITIAADGKVYPCAQLKKSEYLFGDLKTAAAEELLRSPVRARLAELSADATDRCHSCKWVKICHGECLRCYLVGFALTDPAYCNKKLIDAISELPSRAGTSSNAFSRYYNFYS